MAFRFNINVHASRSINIKAQFVLIKSNLMEGAN